MTVNRVEIKIQKEAARNYFARRMNISCHDELDPRGRGGYREKFLDFEKEEPPSLRPVPGAAHFAAVSRGVD